MINKEYLTQQEKENIAKIISKNNINEVQIIELIEQIRIIKSNMIEIVNNEVIKVNIMCEVSKTTKELLLLYNHSIFNQKENSISILSEYDNIINLLDGFEEYEEALINYLFEIREKQHYTIMATNIICNNLNVE